MGTEIRINSRDGKSFAAYLAGAGQTPAPGIVLLPEVFNTNLHIRSVCDGYAADGFTVIAPEVYWRQEPDAYLPFSDEGRAKAQSLRAKLETDQFVQDLEDTIIALRDRSDCTGKVGVMGFCLGGKSTCLSSMSSQTLRTTPKKVVVETSVCSIQVVREVIALPQCFNVICS